MHFLSRDSSYRKMKCWKSFHYHTMVTDDLLKFALDARRTGLVDVATWGWPMSNNGRLSKMMKS